MTPLTLNLKVAINKERSPGQDNNTRTRMEFYDMSRRCSIHLKSLSLCTILICVLVDTPFLLGSKLKFLRMCVVYRNSCISDILSPTQRLAPVDVVIYNNIHVYQ